MWGNIITTDERIIVSMVKYSLGRMSYTPSMAQDAFNDNINRISNTELINTLNLLSNCSNYGSEKIDKRGWLDLKDAILDELHIREKQNRVINPQENRVEVNEEILGFSIRHGLKFIDNDYLFIIDECYRNMEFLSDKNIMLIVKDLSDIDFYLTSTITTDCNEFKLLWNNLEHTLTKRLN